MGRPPQRAPRLHFRAASISRQNAHGSGPGKHWRTRAAGTGESSTGRSRKSCSLARARRCSVRGKSKSCSRRFAVSSVANVQTNRIAFPASSPAASPATAATSPAPNASPTPKPTASPPPAGSPAASPSVPRPVESPASPSAPVAAGGSPAAASAPWPEVTTGEPPMYSVAWHHVHLYSPRSINVDSVMPHIAFFIRRAALVMRLQLRLYI